MSEHVTRSSFTSQNCRFFFFKLSLAQHSTHPFLQWMFIEHPLYTRCCLRHWVRSKAHIGCVLYELTVAAVTNCHELSGSKQPKFIILQLRSQKSKISFTGSKSRCPKYRFFQEALEDNPFPCFFQLLEATYIPYLLAPSFVFNACSAISSGLSLL